MADAQGRARRTNERLDTCCTTTYFVFLPSLTLVDRGFYVRSEFGNSSGPSSRLVLRSLRMLALALLILTLIGSGPIHVVPAR